MKPKQTHGFSLAELLMVVLILGILASAVIPRFSSAVERNRSMEAVQILTALSGSQKRYELENGAYAAALTDLDVTIPASPNFNAPDLVGGTGPDIEIQRNDSSYTLTIDVDGAGTIACSSLSSICTKMGY